MDTKKGMVKSVSREDRESASQVLSSHGWRAVVNLIEELVRAKGTAVLTLTEAEQILQAKSRYDGARELLTDIRRLKEIFKISEE